MYQMPMSNTAPKRAFILSRVNDWEIALKCADRLQAQGWIARIMCDPIDWDVMPTESLPASYSTQGRGMFGIPCALGVIDGILQHSLPGDVVFKTDCDVWLSDACSSWFGAPDMARALRLNKRNKEPWGGAWSANRNHVEQARSVLAVTPPCKCPDSVLYLQSLHRSGKGLEIHPEWMADEWESAFPNRGEHCRTLPIARIIDRYAEAGRMFQASDWTR
jgi:hypothetical protein